MTISYGFSLVKDWWAINELPLTIVFNKLLGLSTVEVESLDVFFNYTTTKRQLMQSNVLWREPREKNLASLQFLIEALTKPGGCCS